jgi:hypothetical protein
MCPGLILRLFQRFDALHQVILINAFPAGLEHVRGGADS